VSACAAPLNPTQRSVESRDVEAGLRRKIVGQDKAVQMVVDKKSLATFPSSSPSNFGATRIAQTGYQAAGKRLTARRSQPFIVGPRMAAYFKS